MISMVSMSLASLTTPMVTIFESVEVKLSLVVISCLSTKMMSFTCLEVHLEGRQI